MPTLAICFQICLSNVECIHVYACWSIDALAKCMYLNTNFEFFNNSTTRPQVSVFSDCFQICKMLIKFRQCSNLIVVSTLVNISTGFSAVLIFCRKIFPLINNFPHKVKSYINMLCMCMINLVL